MAVGKKTGGRRKGSLNKRTISQLDFDPSLSPLEFLTKIYLDESEPTLRRVEAAKAAAPYRHHRLGSKDYFGFRPLMTSKAAPEPREIMQWMIEDLDPAVVRLGEKLRNDVAITIALREKYGGIILQTEDAIQMVFREAPDLENQVMAAADEAGVDLVNFTWLILAAPRHRPDIFPPSTATPPSS